MDASSPAEAGDDGRPADADGSSIATDAREAATDEVGTGADAPDAGDGAVDADGADGADGAVTSDASNDAGTPPDAAPDAGPLACAGQALPATAPPMVSVSGTTLDLGSRSALAGVVLDVFPPVGTAPAATTTSSADGSFSLVIGTGGVPYDGYVRLRRAGFLDSYVVPRAPLASDWTNGTFGMLSSGNATTFPLLVGITQGAGNGVLVVRIADCTGASVAGATVATIPAGQARYIAGGTLSSTANQTDGTGMVYVFNVPAGSVSVSASLVGTQFRAHALTVRGDVFTFTDVSP